MGPSPLLAMYSQKAAMRANLVAALRGVFGAIGVSRSTAARGRGGKKLCVRIYSRTAQVSGHGVRVIYRDERKLGHKFT